MIRKLIRKLRSEAVRTSKANYRILSEELGQYNSIKQWNCIDGNGEPIPWITYPAIEYIKQLDFSGKSIFEYGSGNSTRFWSSRCKELWSVENDVDWYAKIKPYLADNVNYLLREDRVAYVNAIEDYSSEFDVIVIDGRYRYDCALKSLEKLAHNGFIILDNSDWKEKTSRLLREADLIEIDMSGFGPINGYTWTTSFYFRRAVELVPLHGRQPMPAVGSLPHREE